MTAKAITENTLFYGDNLTILREHVADESVDLIYLDPPFNSNRSYNVLFRDESGAESDAQMVAFEDTWHWGPTAEATYRDLVTGHDVPEAVSTAIAAMRQLLGTNQMMAYLSMMAARLVELHRVLKPTGSLYLHCDPTASHYLKIILDAIFGAENFRNEIVWKRSHAHNSANRLGANHDVILFYTKSPEFTWNHVYHEYDQAYIEKHYRHVDETGRRYKRENPTGAGISKGETGKPWRGIDPTIKGRHWARTPEELERLDNEDLIYWPKKKGGWPYIKLFLEDMPGIPLQDVWTDIDPINMRAKERLDYPTQKPVELLERIIEASSNPGDVVLDPFCGCGTAIHAAQKLGRRWLGIDITHLSVSLQKYRLKDAFDLEPGKGYGVVGEPVSLSGAQALAKQDRFQFEWWALSLIQARPTGGKAGSKQGKKGADKGIDGVITFLDGKKGKAQRVLVQVKSGKVKSGDIRDLVGTLDREDAAIGAFITLEKPSKDMVSEAASAGFYETAYWHNPKDGSNRFPRVQILTIEELLEGWRFQLPPVTAQAKTFKKAGREADAEDAGKQGRLL